MTESPPRSGRRWSLVGCALVGLLGLVGAACAPTAPVGEAPADPSPSGTPSQIPAPPEDEASLEDDDRVEEPEPLAWGPTAGEVEAATRRAGEFSDEELASLVIVPRYDGTGAQVPGDLVGQEGFGGVILFGPNVESLPQVQGVAEAVQGAARERGWDWPGIVAVDNEGGQVQRVSAEVGPWTTFPAFAAAGAAGPELVAEAMEAMARELRATGFNTDYAPVGDITGPGDAAIGSRAASDSPGPAALAVEAAVAGFTAGGVLSAVKHFPGHGGLAVDSHVGLPMQPAPVAELAQREFLPFAAAIEAGVPMVMVGHIGIPEWGDGEPTSLIPEPYTYLRQELGFTGVTITDGLDMGALGQDPGEIAIRAMSAGADILLTPADPWAARAGLLEGLTDGRLTRDRLEEAAGRIIAMMRHQQVLAGESGPVSDDDVGAAREVAAELAGG